jgi:protocatechuate 3,4-dioxygenase beta subunit
MHKVTIFLAVLTATAAHAAITGTLVDPDSKPIAGATIRAFAAEDSAAFRARLLAGKIDREALATAKSAENGAFSIDVKGATAVDVMIEAPSRRHVTVPTVDGDDLGAITLAPPPSRTIRVTSAGKPVANAIVVAGSDVERTNASGEVPLVSGAFFVVHPDYAVTRGDSSAGAEVKLARGVAVRGRVVNGAGPVAHAMVMVNGWPVAESADDGSFTVPHAPDRWQSISAVHGNEVGSANRSKAASVEIRLSAGSTFTGTVRDAKRGGAVSGARMTLNGADSSMIAVTDAKGTFTFAPLPPGMVSINGQHSAYAIDASGATLPAMRSRAFSAQPFGRVRGHVIDEERKPVAGALVYGSSTNATRVRSALTNASGEFSIRLVPGSTVPMPIYASKRDYIIAESAPRIWPAGEARDDVVITMVHGFVAQVRVVDRQHQPVPNAQVNVMRSTEGSQRSTFVACADPSRPDCHRTGPDGLVSVRTVEGPHDLTVFGDDVAPTRMPKQMLTVREATATVTVDRGVEINGRVALADGTPVADAIIETPTTIVPRTATSGPDGTFKIAGIAPGSAVLRAFSSDRRLAAPPVTVNAPAKNVTITMPQGARIEGRVLDRATQQPVTDFTILLPSRAGPNRGGFEGGQPIHADDGRYAIDNVTPGQVQLMVNATGYVVAMRGDITVEDGKTASGIDIQLDRGATITGHVTAAGAPVAGVQVRQSFERTPVFSNTTTDADGLYTLQGVAQGDHTIEFQKMGFVVLHKPVEVAAGKDVRLDAELDAGQELRGRVVDRSGQGVSGVYVAVGSGGMRPGTTVSTDGDGAFAIQGLDSGKYSLMIRKDGYAGGNLTDIDVPQARPITFTLDSGATITGRVTGIPPEQFTQVTVTASGDTSRSQTFADAGGGFTLRGFSDGRVRVDAILSAGGQRRMAPYKTIDIENGSAPMVELNFEEGMTVTGRVTRSGAPLSNGSIIFIPRGSSATPSLQRQVVNAMISPDGVYTASGLAAGDYDVRVNDAGTAFATKYTATASGTFDIDIHGATLHGRVIDATTGAPLANARVSVTSRAPAFGFGTTDSDGRFTIDSLVDANYEMQASHDQYATSIRPMTVSNGAAQDVEIRLEQAPAVTIHIVDAATGTAVDGNVIITDPASHAFSGQAVRVDTGTFRAWLKPGSYNAGASARGYMFKTMNFTTPPNDVSVALSHGGALLIRARSTQQVRLDLPGGVTQRLLGIVHAGTNGPYESLAAGSFVITTFGSDGKVIRSVPVTIVAGETVTIDLP